MRATADGLNDELIKLTAEKATLKTKLTTRTTARSHTLAYKTEAGRNREKLDALEGGIIEILRHEREQFEIKPPCVIVTSVPLIKSHRIRCLTPQRDEVYRSGYGSLRLLASLSMY